MENKITKKLYTAILVSIISFWCIVIVGGVTVYHTVKEVQASQVQLSKITETVENIDFSDDGSMDF